MAGKGKHRRVQQDMGGYKEEEEHKGEQHKTEEDYNKIIPRLGRRIRLRRRTLFGRRSRLWRRARQARNRRIGEIGRRI